MNAFMDWLDTHPVCWPVFIFVARVVDVSIGTLRTICVVRGMRITAAVLGFFEVSIWVTAISGVLHNLNNGYNVIAYAAGFASGNALGIFIEQKLAMGMQMVRLISRTNSRAIAAGLRLAGYTVTEVKGEGLKGEVSIAFVVAARKETPHVMGLAQQIDPKVISTVEDVRSTNLRRSYNGPPPTGWRAILKRK